MQTNVDSARTPTRNRNIGRIAPESGNIFLYPSQNGGFILQSEIAFNCIVFGAQEAFKKTVIRKIAKKKRLRGYTCVYQMLPFCMTLLWELQACP